jgi:hypothetical protein
LNAPASPWQAQQRGYSEGQALSSHARSERLLCYADLAAGRSSPCTAPRRTPTREGDQTMAFKPNYNQQRSERNRIKEAKKQEKLAKREEEVAKRRAAREAEAGAETVPEHE